MVALLTIGVGAGIVGPWQRWAGLFFAGIGLTLIVVGIELIDLGRFLPQWLAFAIAGVALIATGAGGSGCDSAGGPAPPGCDRGCRGVRARLTWTRIPSAP